MKSSAKALKASSGQQQQKNSTEISTSFASIPKSGNDSKVILNGSNDSRICEACEKQPKFSSFQEFAFHLRTQHCSKEGGSFVCRYGLNGVCQTLPVEGVSDEDYEKHIRKCHLKKSSKFMI
jgi:hypothetical protein